jgi:hypothetical protein
MARLDQTGRAQPTPETPFSGNEDPTTPAVPGIAASALSDPLPSQAAQPVAPQTAVRLPYPFSLMNPADVPEEVWKQARAGRRTLGDSKGVLDRRALAGQARVPFGKGFEGHQGSLATANRSPISSKGQPGAWRWRVWLL